MATKRGIRRDDFRQVKPTEQELADWVKKNGTRHRPPYRAECKFCGKRMWYSGIGIGSHLRACDRTPKPIIVSLSLEDALAKLIELRDECVTTKADAAERNDNELYDTYQARQIALEDAIALVNRVERA